MPLRIYAIVAAAALIAALIMAAALVIVGLTGKAAQDWDGGGGHRRGHSDTLYPPKTPPAVEEVTQ